MIINKTAFLLWKLVELSIKVLFSCQSLSPQALPTAFIYQLPSSLCTVKLFGLVSTFSMCPVLENSANGVALLFLLYLSTLYLSQFSLYHHRHVWISCHVKTDLVVFSAKSQELLTDMTGGRVVCRKINLLQSLTSLFANWHLVINDSLNNLQVYKLILNKLLSIFSVLLVLIQGWCETKR